MRNIIAKVKNIKALIIAHESLLKNDEAVPERMGLVYGVSGAGKTTATAWLVNQCGGVYVRAQATWTPISMLHKICKEMGLPELTRCNPMVEAIAERLRLTNQTLFVDEADYLLFNLKMIETLRDIHDLATSPVILIGMDDIDRRLTNRKQLSRRISQIVKFEPCSMVDARTLVDTCCEVGISDDLLEKIHDRAKGNIGEMTVGLSRIEAFAKTQRWEMINASQWESSGKQLFLTRKGGR